MILVVKIYPGREKEDHETSNLKDVLRRMLQEMQRNKAKKSEDLDHLESWHKQRSSTGFPVGILHLNSKPCPLADSHLATQFPDRMLVVRSQDYDHQTGPFHPDRLAGSFSSRC